MLCATVNVAINESSISRRACYEDEPAQFSTGQFPLYTRLNQDISKHAGQPTFSYKHDKHF